MTITINSSLSGSVTTDLPEITYVDDLVPITDLSNEDRVRLHLLFVIAPNGISVPCGDLRNSLPDKNISFESEEDCERTLNNMPATQRGILISHIRRHLNNVLGNLHI